MGNFLPSDKKPLATTSQENKTYQFIWFKDHVCPPQFQDINSGRLEERIKEPKSSKIKEHFKALSNELNEVIKVEYGIEDRKSFNKAANVFWPMYAVFMFAFFFLGLWMLRVFFAGKQQLLITLCYPFSVISIVVIVMTFAFDCCFGKDEMEKRLTLQIKCVVNKWNSNNEDKELIVEYKAMSYEWKKGMPPILNLWKREDLKSDTIV